MPSEVVGFVECTVCNMRKKPYGRSAPIGDGPYCTGECPGYYEEPLAGALWPGERSDNAE